MTEELFIETDYGYCFYTFENYPGALIYNLYVYPQFRRQGLACNFYKTFNLKILEKEIHHAFSN